MSTKTRFEKEAKGNSEMVYWYEDAYLLFMTKLPYCYHLNYSYYNNYCYFCMWALTFLCPVMVLNITIIIVYFSMTKGNIIACNAGVFLRAHFDRASAILDSNSEKAWGETKMRPREWELG